MWRRAQLLLVFPYFFIEFGEVVKSHVYLSLDVL